MHLLKKIYNSKLDMSEKSLNLNRVEQVANHIQRMADVSFVYFQQYSSYKRITRSFSPSGISLLIFKKQEKYHWLQHM